MPGRRAWLLAIRLTFIVWLSGLTAVPTETIVPRTAAAMVATPAASPTPSATPRGSHDGSAVLPDPPPILTPPPATPQASDLPAGSDRPGSGASEPQPTPAVKPPTPEVTLPTPEDPLPAPASASEPGIRVGTIKPINIYSGGGMLLERAFDSPAIGQNIAYLVFVPPRYVLSDRRYPTLFMLHGVDADSSQWPEFGLCDAADEMIAAGEIEPFVIVMPFGSNSYFLNRPGGPRWSDHLRDEILPDVETLYRTIPRPSSRAIGGLSMGAEAALRFALTSPDLFGVVGAHSPSIRRSFDDARPDLFADVEEFNQANPIWLIEHVGVPKGLKIWIDIGDGDPWWWTAEMLHDALLDEGIEHEFHYFAGEHEASYWAAHVADYLRFYAAALDKSPLLAL